MEASKPTRRLRVAGGIALALLMGVTSAGCSGGSSNADGSAPEQLVIAMPEDVDTFDVLTALASTTHAYIGVNIAETLTHWDPDTDTHEPLLATEWERTGDLEWTIAIRPDVTFSDGSAMTAEDVVDSIEYAITNDTPYYQSFFPTIESAEATDDETVVITTTQPDPVLYKRLQFISVLPSEHLDPDFLANDLVGTGPYALSEYVRGQRIVLDRNDDYWGDEPEFASVRFDIRPDASVRASSVQTGEAQIALSLNVEQAGSVPKLLEVPGGEVNGFILNTIGQTEGSIMEDVRVRKAVNMAIDRQAIADQVFDGHAVLPNGQYNTPVMTGTDPDLRDYPYDPDEARALLEEAGVIGQPIRIRTNTTRWAKSGELTDAVAGYFEAVGLVPEVTAVDFATWQKTQTDDLAGENAPFELFLTNHGNEFFDSSMKTANSLLSREAGRGIWLIGDPQLDTMLKAAIVEADPDHRVELMQEAWRYVYDQAYLLPIVVPNFIQGVNEHIEWAPRSDERLYLDEISWN